MLVSDIFSTLKINLTPMPAKKVTKIAKKTKKVTKKNTPATTKAKAATKKTVAKKKVAKKVTTRPKATGAVANNKSNNSAL